MQKQSEDIGVKVEFVKHENRNVEIRYFDTPRDSTYRSWKLPREVVEEVISWWGKLTKNKDIHFPIKEKAKFSEFTMNTDKHIDIKEFDSLGRYKMIGWSLPIVVL